MPKAVNITENQKKLLNIRVDPRQDALADEIIKDIKSGKRRTTKELMKTVGYSSNTATKQGTRTLTSESLRQCLLAKGLDEDRMRKVLDDAMGAGVVTTFKGDAKETDAPDYKTRLAAVNMLGEFMGLKKMVIEQKNLNVNIDAKDILDAIGD
jgi:hypothetical protein